jgi:hypothetical protein
VLADADTGNAMDLEQATDHAEVVMAAFRTG